MEGEALDLEAVFDALEDLLYVYGGDGTLVHWNDRVEEVTGYGAEQLRSMTPAEFVPPEEREKIRGYVERSRQAGEAAVDSKLLTADGETIPYEFLSKAVTVDGEVVGRVGVGREITERKRYERELESHVAAMEAAIDGMAVLGEDDTYEFVNRAHAKMYGYEDPTRLEGKSWRVCYADEELARFEAEVLPELRETGAWRGEAVGTRRDGTTFPQELSLSLTDAGRIVCVVRDITERKEYERRLRERNERLGEFSRLLAHDLRNPLTIVRGHADMWAEISDERSHYEAIDRAIDRMEQLISDALRLTESGGPIAPGEREPVDLASAAERAWGGVDTADATLELEGTATLDADESRLRQVLENLFRNAVEHGSSNGADRGPTVWVGPLKAGGFYVEDDGPGIPADDRESVFEMGFTTKPDGTGYGLASVEQLVDAHGWTVSVTDGREGGARFEVRAAD